MPPQQKTVHSLLVFCSRTIHQSSILRKKLAKSDSRAATDFDSKTHFATNTLRERLEPIFQFTSEKKRNATGVFGFGFCPTGALGRPELMNETLRKTNRPALQHARRPLLVKYFHQNQLKVKHVACGFGFTVFVCQSTSSRSTGVYACGINSDSQLGFQKKCLRGNVKGWPITLVLEPQKIDLPNKDNNGRLYYNKWAACGQAHTVVVQKPIDENGNDTVSDRLVCLGNNVFGQCGRPIVEDENYQNSHLIHFVNFESCLKKPLRIKQIECGTGHTLVLTEDGEVFSFGRGLEGQLGHGSCDSAYHPVRVGGDIEGEKIVQISSRVNTTLAVSASGQLFGWGASPYRLIYSCPDEANVPAPVHLPLPPSVNGSVIQAATTANTCAILDQHGQVHSWGMGPCLGFGPDSSMVTWPTLLPPSLFGKTSLDDLDKCSKPKQTLSHYCVTQIQGGVEHIMAVTQSGSLYCWGNNSYGATGLQHKRMLQTFPWRVPFIGIVQKLACGSEHSMIVAKL